MVAIKLKFKHNPAMTKHTSTFGEVIRKERLKQKLSCGELARRAGVREFNIHGAERGQMPSLVRAGAILRGLGMKLTIGRTEGRKRIAYTPPEVP
jgi:ribosome-binding protein aMBF1 (putative translation factor)